jgi:hypothetical protein
MPRNLEIRPRPPFSSETCLCADLTYSLLLAYRSSKDVKVKSMSQRGGEGGKAARRLCVIMTIIVSNHFSRFFGQPQSRTRTYDLIGRTLKRNKWDPSDT